MHLDSKKILGRAWGLGLLAAVWTLAGCGNASSPETSPIAFKSPAVRANGVIRSNVSCGYGSLWLPLEWGAVPSGTKELAVYIGRYEYREVDGAKKLVVPFADLVAHIDPSTRHIAANVLPEGVTWSYFGRASCPQVRKGQNIVQQLFALDRTQQSRELNVRLATRLTEEALAQGKAEGASPRSPGSLTEDAVGVGRFIATYGP